MAATLPPIQHGRGPGSNGGLSPPTSQPIPQNVVQFVQPIAPLPPRSPNNRQVLQPLRKTQGKKDREASVLKDDLRAQQPILTKLQTSVYRNTYEHTLCVEMLQEGYHQSFSELFALMERQRLERERAGPESVLWTKTQLHDEPDKLDVLSEKLTQAEAALRRGDYTEVYNARLELAKSFQATGDKWLLNHFFQTCLMMAQLIKGDDGSTLSQAHCYVGIALEEDDEFLEAVTHFESFYELTLKKLTESEDDKSIQLEHSLACQHLWRIYMTIGSTTYADNHLRGIEYFQKAHKMAVEADNSHMIGESCYKLGLAHQKAGDQKSALQHLEQFLSASEQNEDPEAMGHACGAIANAYKLLGDIESCVTYLKRYVQVAEENNQEHAYSRACHSLGAIYNVMGRYVEASEYFSKAYNLSRAQNDKETISVNRVQYGIALAHKMVGGFGKNVVIGNRTCLERLSEWKNARTDEFEKGVMPEDSKISPVPES